MVAPGGEALGYSLMRHLVVMLPEEIFAEIVFEIAPDGVDVVGVVLGVVVFEQERWPLHAVIVGFAPFDATGPGEIDFVQAGFGDLL